MTIYLKKVPEEEFSACCGCYFFKGDSTKGCNYKYYIFKIACIDQGIIYKQVKKDGNK